MVKLTAEIENTEPFSVYRERYHNEAITELVKNITETHRIIEKDGKLIQKIYPVYKDPDPDHPIDFDAQFYMPEKHFLNHQMDTFYFNTCSDLVHELLPGDPFVHRCFAKDY